MRGRNLMNVNNAMKNLIKNETSKGILNWFMRGRNLMNVNIDTKDLMKKKTPKGTLNRFMSGRNLMNVNKAIPQVLIFPPGSGFECVTACC